MASEGRGADAHRCEFIGMTGMKATVNGTWAWKVRWMMVCSHSTSGPSLLNLGLPGRANLCWCSQDCWGVKTHQCQRARSASFANFQRKRSVESPSAEGDLAQESPNGIIYSQRGRPGVIVATDIVNLLCHFIGIWMIPYFWKCDVYYAKNIKQNMSILKAQSSMHPVYTFDLVTRCTTRSAPKRSFRRDL